MLPTVRAEPIVVVVAAAVLLAAGGSAHAIELGQVMALAQSGADTANGWLMSAYARRPVVVIGLGAAAALPLLLLMGLLLHRGRGKHGLPAAEPQRDAAAGAALLEIDGASPIVLPAGRDLIQIGRDDDNDIRLDDDSVQNYHAVIERSAGAGFTITDVSGLDRDGLRVNGERCPNAVLTHGDTVELGRTKLRFATVA